MTANLQPERGWLPDLLYTEGRFETGTAMFAAHDGRITRFSKQPEDLRTAQPLAGRAILPGLVNVHSHSFQRAIRGRTEHRTNLGGDNFWTWRDAMYHAANRLTPEDIHDVAAMTFLEALKSGITTVGEFHYLHHAADGTRYPDPNLLAMQNVRAAQAAGVRIALLRTAYVRAGWNQAPNPGQLRFITSDVDDFIAHTDELRSTLASSAHPGQAWVGVAPHSIRAVPLGYLRVVADYARSHAMPIHMHVSEQPAEIEACLGEYGLRPIELLAREGIVGPRFTGIHATHVTDVEISQMASSGASICACPTTERNLGDGIGPADRWATAGVKVCYGSDSNVQINLLEDARELEYHLRLQRLERAVLAPDLSPDGLAKRLFENAATVGAASLGAPGGTLQPGLPADFFTVDLDDVSIAGADAASLLTNIVFSAERTAIRDVYVGGTAVIEDGRHQQEEQIVQRFTAVQQRLWRDAQ